MARNWILLAVLGVAAADPLVFTSPYLASPFLTQYAAPYTSAALVAPGPAAALVAPGPAAVPAGVPAAVPATLPLSSVSAYSYGSSYSIQDYAAAPLYSSAYSLPYSYADWFYRR